MVEVPIYSDNESPAICEHCHKDVSDTRKLNPCINTLTNLPIKTCEECTALPHIVPMDECFPSSDVVM